tara:strand:+ start:25567 stop:26307 length:741 start_codon:yes stop_codon:yes gene_type:complete
MSESNIKLTELLITVVSRMLRDLNHVAVGASSPIPGAAALLASGLGKGSPKVTILGSKSVNSFTDGGKELFDCAGQGRIDAFFLGGGQIDGDANVNLVGIGDYPHMDVRFPGSYGSAYLYYVVPKVILFREEHTSRTLVQKVDFISAPGKTEKNIYRPGGPHSLVTSRCVFMWEKKAQCFSLHSLHPGETLQTIRKNTGFDYIEPKKVINTLEPTEQEKKLIHGDIGKMIAEVYPSFASSRLAVDS